MKCLNTHIFTYIQSPSSQFQYRSAYKVSNILVTIISIVNTVIEHSLFMFFIFSSALMSHAYFYIRYLPPRFIPLLMHPPNQSCICRFTKCIRFCFSWLFYYYYWSFVASNFVDCLVRFAICFYMCRCTMDELTMNKMCCVSCFIWFRVLSARHKLHFRASVKHLLFFRVSFSRIWK